MWEKGGRWEVKLCERRRRDNRRNYVRYGRKATFEIRREKGGRDTGEIVWGGEGGSTKLTVQQRTTSTALNIHNNTTGHTQTTVFCEFVGKHLIITRVGTYFNSMRLRPGVERDTLVGTWWSYVLLQLSSCLADRPYMACVTYMTVLIGF